MNIDHILSDRGQNLDPGSVTLKRSPRQARSRERVERLLQVAEGLVAKYGNTAFSMRELAVQAGMPIATAYQYFPNQDAVVRQLAIRYHEAFLEWMIGRFGPISSREEFFDTIMEVMHSWIETYEQTPSYRGLWSGSQGSETLRKLDAEDTRRYARIIADALRRLKPDVDDDRAFAGSLLLCDTTSSLTRLAFDCPLRERERLIEEFESMAKLYVRNLLD
ncbi:MAG: TetR/AcrR family transcriptional regulator [Mesorhizobium sp.]